MDNHTYIRLINKEYPLPAGFIPANLVDSGIPFDAPADDENELPVLNCDVDVTQSLVSGFVCFIYIPQFDHLYPLKSFNFLCRVPLPRSANLDSASLHTR